MEKHSLFGYFIECFKEYAYFDGRARRREFWGFNLFAYIFYFILYFFELMMGTDFLCLIFCLVAGIPQLSVAVRRLHDVGKSGWFIFIGLIPIIGSIWLLVLYCIDSEPFENRFGPNPKADDSILE